MLNLIPAEHWEYEISDLIHGIAAASAQDSQREILLPGIGNCLTIGSGRAGLAVAIRALNLKSGARIGVPLYCCPVLLDAIDLADCRPQFIDITSDTFCISPQDLAKKIVCLDAVLVVHMFGNMCDMRILREIAQDKPVIEDCAQALGSKIEDKIAGSFGDIAFFSFRSGKYLSVGEGGAVFSPDEEICNKLRKLIASLPNISYWNEILHILKTYIRSKLRSEPLYGIIGYQLWNFYSRIAHTAKTFISINHIYKADYAIAVKRLQYIDKTITKQRDNACYYAQNLKLERGMICREKPGTFYNRYLYPIIFSTSEQRDWMAEYMYEKGIGVIKPYSNIKTFAEKNYGYQGDCPISEMIAACVLAIPNHYNLSEEDRWHIAKSLNEGWDAIFNK